MWSFFAIAAALASLLLATPGVEARPDMVIASEGYGSWGRRALDPALAFAFPGTNFTWVLGAVAAAAGITPNLVIRSMYSGEPYFNYTAPYITWSSEGYPVKLKPDYPPLCELVNYKPGNTSTHPTFYVPYVIDAPFTLPHIRLYQNNTRPYWVSYISSNCVPERERMFDLLRRRLGNHVHGLGRCSHNHPGHNGTSWYGNGDVYKDYVFALIMENRLTDWYITEKITLAFRGGAIPIYWGDPGGKIAEIFNPKAYLRLNDFPTQEACVDHIIGMINEPGRPRIRAMQLEPVFRDGLAPEYFQVDLWPPPPWIQEIGRHIRRSYRAFVSR